MLELYKTLHPEDTGATEDMLDIVTIDNVLTDNLYNDLGIMVGNNRLLLLLLNTKLYLMAKGTPLLEKGSV